MFQKQSIFEKNISNKRVVEFKKSIYNLISLTLGRQDQDKVTFLNEDSRICIFL